MRLSKTEKALVSLIKKSYPKVEAIYLFGSFGTKFETPASDIDLAILLPSATNTVALWEKSQKIASKMRRDVDLIDLKQVSTVFQYQIINTGKRLYCPDTAKCDFFENNVFSEYLDFNQRRKPILEDIEQRGRILSER
ncbi:MAG: nucleotidyltransferase domain-containing protein [Gammaproteobacteria bacterium]|nr:nucleotidyltransferase domain-containing protein [Gammaproteobacteria bacterium]